MVADKSPWTMAHKIIEKTLMSWVISEQALIPSLLLLRYEENFTQGLMKLSSAVQRDMTVFHPFTKQPREKERTLESSEKGSALGKKLQNYTGHLLTLYFESFLIVSFQLQYRRLVICTRARSGRAVLT